MAITIYGKNAVLSSLDEGKVLRLFLAPQIKDEKVLSIARQMNIEIKVMSVSQLDQMTNHGVHQGMVAEVNDFEYTDLKNLIKQAKKKSLPLLLMLDGINDPHNFGAIIRSADAFGVDGIIIKKTNQVAVTATVIKVATGATNYVPVCQVTNLTQTLHLLKEEGFWAVATDGSAKQNYLDIDYKIPIVLIIGSEGEGISKLVLANSDFTVKIPMVGHVNSLNASVATAVLLAGIVSKR
ncbi:MAG: 23S rRNA (guanosine(2251)-2'-O)-methyltransferase RlmB [Methanomicrobia archaeon]|nr:23S rRNA (guanosine(2251)-2'-O)-methyltransferase RlmB [Methanomicrobia archaeon]